MIDINTLDSKIEDINRCLEKEKKNSSMLSIGRLIISLALIWFIIKSFSGGIDFKESSIIILGVALFGVLIFFHMKVKKREKYFKTKIKIIENYKMRINGGWTGFEDIGEEGIDPSHLYTGDLDIFGRGSLFQLINCAKTFLGRKSLIDTLNGLKKEDIEKKQLGVKEISDNLDFSIEIQTLGEVNIDKSKDPKDLIDYANDISTSYSSKVLRYIVYTIPVILIVSSFTAYITLNRIFFFIALGALIINIFLTGYFMIKGYEGFSKVSPFKKNIKAYLHNIKLIEESEFNSQYLKDIQGKLKEEVNASKVIKKLEKIVDSIDLRYNPFAYLLLNIIFLWDYQCVFSLEDFKVKYGKKINDYLEAVGKIEEVISLGVISQVNEKTVFPSIENSEKVFVKAKRLGHPLIDSKVRISNDITIEDKILVITGSNMSGKTTFLRTLGINLVLAYSGSAVVSEKFSSTVMDILTSMRITDNLEMGISTFYAELIRIKSIIEASKSNKPMMFLIDEIFRGTNSKDRITGAVNVLKSLSKQGIIGCISTHDFELCDISSSRIENFHFEEHYKDGKILFDYKIKDGVSTTKNAKYLMRMVGIDIKE